MSRLQQATVSVIEREDRQLKEKEQTFDTTYFT